jgi:Protein of unknown function (DUF2442)
MRREMLRIRKVAPTTDHRVRLTLTNDDVVERDLSALLWGPVFEPLRSDANRFRQVTVSGGTLVWPGDLDFDPDTLIWGGPRPADPNTRPPKFLALGSRTTAAPQS